MATKTKTSNLSKYDLSPTHVELIQSVVRSRSLPALAGLIKTGIRRRDELMGKVSPRDRGEFHASLERQLKKAGDAKVRNRLIDLCDAILVVEDRKAISVMCRLIIQARKEAREAAKAAKAAKPEAAEQG